ncbi:AAA family ATPase [Entomomonas sp. E2T0]|uniref:ExeA family protein n=1 Tax=Entomomonas sp. E2T0 TaxID=2930213 RepID=UPI0022283724|nr:AAA family ATPase [Entomomonas sp. E2T0]UYZ84309.1 AAA family ATPase [Entomomonas sp. E2T0]
MLQLKQVIADHRLKQSNLAQYLNVSNTAVSLLINLNTWPKKTDKAEFKQRIISWLAQKGITANDSVFNVVTEGGHPQPLLEISPPTNNEDYYMILEKQHLTKAAGNAFDLKVNPFDEPRSIDDLYLSPEAKILYEDLYIATKCSQFIAVIGESGSGKTTLKKALKARVARAKDKVIFVEPYIIGMESNDQKGKSLKVTQIIDAIKAAIAPTAAKPRSIDDRFRQVHTLAAEAVSNGYQIVIIIEEAHSLPNDTLRHFKRILEMESPDGFNSLFTVLLIAQPELLLTLSKHNKEIREVTQRCTIEKLAPVTNYLEDYLAHTFNKANKKLAEVIDQSGIDELKQKLSYRRYGETEPNHYPLVINNTLIAAMNIAAETGQSLITGEIIKEV